MEQRQKVHSFEQKDQKQKDLNATSCLNTTDTGRSMVEMLGTLAIAGVISVGGIAGYQYAMNQYRANQVANERMNCS